MTAEAEAIETPKSPPRWSEAFPLGAALVYALVYLALAVGGGYLMLARLPGLALGVLITLVGTATMGLSLLFVLSVCRIPLRAGAEALVLVPTAGVFLLLRPEVTVPLAMLLRLPPALALASARAGMLPGADPVGNIALILFAVFVGRLVSHVIREGKLLLPVAFVASAADIITVFWGFVGHAVKEAPKIVEALSAQAPMRPPEGVPAPILTSIGIGDFLFLGIFFAVALRHSMQAAKGMWAAFVAMLVAAVVLVVWRGGLGIPGLPFITVGVLLVNRRYLTFTRDEKRSLIVVGLLLLGVIALLAAKMLLGERR